MMQAGLLIFMLYCSFSYTSEAIKSSIHAPISRIITIVPHKTSYVAGVSNQCGLCHAKLLAGQDYVFWPTPTGLHAHASCYKVIWPSYNPIRNYLWKTVVLTYKRSVPTYYVTQFFDAGRIHTSMALNEHCSPESLHAYASSHSRGELKTLFLHYGLSACKEFCSRNDSVLATIACLVDRYKDQFPKHVTSPAQLFPPEDCPALDRAIASYITVTGPDSFTQSLAGDALTSML